MVNKTDTVTEAYLICGILTMRTKIILHIRGSCLLMREGGDFMLGIHSLELYNENIDAIIFSSGVL